MDRVETKRLIGERLTQRHVELLVRFLGDARVAATLGGVQPDPELRKWVRRGAAHWDDHGFGKWVFHERETGDFVGRGGLGKVVIDDVDEVEVGYAVVPERWGEGFATEMAFASLQVGFEQLELSELVAFTLPNNLASRRVMEKVGFAYERDFVWGLHPHVLYRIRSGSRSDG